MVVLDRRTGEWMLPGGLAHRGEDAAQTGARETREETGLRLSKRRLRRVSSRNGVSLYEHPAVVSRSRTKRLRQFKRRPHAHETADYGFVRPGTGVLHVETYDGRFKPNGPFR